MMDIDYQATVYRLATVGQDGHYTYMSCSHREDGEKALALLKLMVDVPLAVISEGFHENWGPGHPASWKIAGSSTSAGDPIQPYVQAVWWWLLSWFLTHDYEPFTVTDVSTAEGYRYTYYLRKTTLDKPPA